MVQRTLDLDVSARSVELGRRLVRDALATVPEDAVEVTAGLTDELVANAVEHGRPPIALTLEFDGHVIVVSVADHGLGSPAMMHAGPNDEHGRGLLIVDLLATSWGVEPMARGKRVWFRLVVPDGRPPPTR
jgi:anti-sigma regulatory factor (Ser/Thr protein kinase)